MCLGRARYRTDLFVRKTDYSWSLRPDEGGTRFASCMMEVTGELEPAAVGGLPTLTDLSNRQPFIHQYCWTVSLTGLGGHDWLDQLHEDEALLVQLIVYTGRSRFVAKEVCATLEFLPPTRNIRELPGRQLVKSALQGVKAAAGAVGVNVVAAASGVLASVIPPDYEGVRWFLHKFDVRVEEDGGNACGIEWHISRRLIQEVGTRLSGRLDLYFLDAPIQDDGEHDGADDVVFLQGKFGMKCRLEPTMGHAVFPLRPHLTLRIAPRLPAPGPVPGQVSPGAEVQLPGLVLAPPHPVP